MQNHADILRHERYPRKAGDVQHGSPLGKPHAKSGGRDGKHREKHPRHEQIMAPRPFDEPHLSTPQSAKHLHERIVSAREAVHREDKRNRGKSAEERNRREAKPRFFHPFNIHVAIIPP